MTTKQAEKIGKGLLPDLPGFVAGGKMVFKSPLEDFLCGLYFENTSDANCFHLWVFFLPLFIPNDGVSFNYGKRIGNAVNWRLDNPNLLVDLRAVIHCEAIPFLNSVSTLAGVLNFLKADVEMDRQRVNPHTLEALACTLIKNGDYSPALEVLDELKQRFSKSTTPWVLELAARAGSVEEKLLPKPEVALAQLEIWKAETIDKLGLEKYCNRSASTPNLSSARVTP
ncbi:MAG: hypothetical protein ABSE16_04640 [Verrucomicrobiota bacterium]|jgi:hypothetical protein